MPPGVVVVELPGGGTSLWELGSAPSRKEFSAMLIEYIQAALRLAKYEILSDDGSYCGDIPECNGVRTSKEKRSDPTTHGSFLESMAVAIHAMLLRVRGRLRLLTCQQGNERKRMPHPSLSSTWAGRRRPRFE